MNIEYPPEPIISYGVFNHNSRPVTPGYAGRAQTGFGILNLPLNAVGLVDSERTPLLEDYLNMAKKEWQKECLTIDFDAVENKLEFLVGCTLGYSWLYSDQFGTEVRLPVDIDPGQSRHQLVFEYSPVNLVTGLKTFDEVQNHLQSHARLEVVNVEGEKITLSDGFEFYLTSRYKESVPPKLNPYQSVKALLMQNLVMQRAKRDSAGATPVNDDQAIESVAA